MTTYPVSISPSVAAAASRSVVRWIRSSEVDDNFPLWTATEGDIAAVPAEVYYEGVSPWSVVGLGSRCSCGVALSRGLLFFFFSFCNFISYVA